ncbi:MAG: hypothetical protein ABIG87_02140, partial [Patescibacteria group bacterium]
DSVGAIINSNTFDNHADFPIIISGSPNINITNNSGANNEINGINIFGTMTNQTATTTLSYNPLPYILDNALTVAENTALEIGPETVFKIAKKGLNSFGFINVDGYLNIAGGVNSADKVLFTSVYDNSDGTNVYGGDAIDTSTITKLGEINLISASSTIENAEFRYLDKALSYIDKAISYNVPSLPSSIDLKNVIFENNTWSIFVDSLSDTPVHRADNIMFVGNQSMSVLEGCAIIDNKLICSLD